MSSQDVMEFPSGGDLLYPRDRHTRAHQFGQVIIIAALLAISSFIVYATGGTGYAYPYVMLIPVILAAAWFGLFASVGCAVLGGLLLGPYMPLDVSQGIVQSTDNWLARIAFFLLIGVFTSWLFQNLHSANLRHLQGLKIDSETGLRNQSALFDDLRNALGQVRKENLSKRSVAVVLVRMQDLWEILEAMGTHTSELVVAEIANRISGNIDASHQIYRFSTSELAILFFARTQEEVDAISDAARAIGEEESLVNGVPLRVQLVAGSYLVEKGVRESETVINRARTGLFAAIDSHVFYKPYDPVFDQKTAERVQLVARVRDGLNKDEFELFYQPKVSLETGRHVGAEALLRWFDPDGRIIMPGLFMPKLESTSLIDPVTRFVVAQACADIKRHKLMSVSINFAIKNLMDEALISELGAMVASFGVHPRALEIEITEGALIQDPAQAKAAVESLRRQGFKVSLDDFGTGYSSFQYLSHLPLSGLKIDRAFVTNLEESADARTVMKSMIDMAHALKLEVTVEGVESEGQQEIVAGLGADLVQGFLFSKPMPLPQYLKWGSALAADTKPV